MGRRKGSRIKGFEGFQKRTAGFRIKDIEGKKLRNSTFSPRRRLYEPEALFQIRYLSAVIVAGSFLDSLDPSNP
jgi:hypothetical protein